MTCDRCGCSDLRACAGGCWWAAPGLCSRCAYQRRGGRLRAAMLLLSDVWGLVGFLRQRRADNRQMP